LSWIKYFPKKSVRRFIISQTLFLFFLSLTVVLCVRFFVSEEIAKYPEVVSLASKMDDYVLQLMWVVSGLFVIYFVQGLLTYLVR